MNEKLKLDIHLNLGDIPTTKKKTPLICTPQAMIDYINKYNLTHAVVLYRDIVEYRAVRSAISASVILYPLKWVVDVEYDMEMMLENEPESKGVCIHSHRGTVDGVTFGLDYAGRLIHNKIFKKLPENSIICVHTQGVNSYRNISKGLSVVKWAAKYPHLKFLIEHTGSYLRKEFYPKITKWEDLQEGQGHAPAFLQDAIGSQVCIYEASLAAEKMHNIFCDSSIVSSRNYKSIILAENTQWAFGSDWPFENDLCPIEKQEKTFIKYHGYNEDGIQQIHRRGIDFLEKSTIQLFNEHYIQE